MNGYETLVDERVAARRLNLTVHAIRKMRQTGRGPTPVRLGYAVRYETGELDRVARQRAEERRGSGR
jgi:hypothetical protein